MNSIHGLLEFHDPRLWTLRTEEKAEGRSLAAGVLWTGVTPLVTAWCVSITTSNPLFCWVLDAEVPVEKMCVLELGVCREGIPHFRVECARVLMPCPLSSSVALLLYFFDLVFLI